MCVESASVCGEGAVCVKSVSVCESVSVCGEGQCV